jgi:hypothetical protein
MTREEELQELEYRRYKKICTETNYEGFKTAFCPTCKEYLSGAEMFYFCPSCGQKLDWEGMFE